MKPQLVAPDQPLAPGVYWIYILANNAVVEIVRRWPAMAQRIADQMQRQFGGRVTLTSRGLAWVDTNDGPRLHWVIEAAVKEQPTATISGTAKPMVAAGAVITGIAIIAALALILEITLTIGQIVRVKTDYCIENPELCASREQTYRWLAYAAAIVSAAMLLKQLWR